MRSNDITFHTAPTADGTTSTPTDPLWVAVRQDRLQWQVVNTAPV